MANVKITDLTAVVSITPASDVVPLVSGGSTKKATPTQIVNSVLNAATSVGVGTTTPFVKLNAVDTSVAAVTALAINNSNTGLAVNEAVDIDFGLGSLVAALHGKIRIGNSTVTTGANSYMSLYTRTSSSLTEKMRIDSSGNVGIGNTPSGTYKLEVTGAIGATTSITSATNVTNGVTTGSSSIGAFSYGTLGYVDVNHLATYQTTVNSYIQTEIQNTNVGASASSDHIVANNLTTSTTYYGDFGMNSSGWVGSGSLNTANMVYLTSTTGDLAIGTTTANSIHFVIGNGTTDAMKIDSLSNVYIGSGNLWQYAPAPTALAAGANAITATQLQGDIFTVATAITTAVTMTLPLGTALDSGFTGVPKVDIGFDFHIVNAGITSAAVTVAVNTGITSVGSLTVAIGTSAGFRLRRTAVSTYILYRLY
jgi:hypothetical protein